MAMSGEMASRILRLAFTVHMAVLASALEDCPMVEIKSVVRNAIAFAGKHADAQMPLIKRLVEETYGGRWGVVIVTDAYLIGSAVHWSVPFFPNEVGTDAVCIHVEDG
ncbi:Protein C54D10.9 [Aphelenchoides avenae]|nr:Protein C54D10.9 [Aphelenchus avenae]